jgi:tetratricopeptide (TPR) repeat protein
MSRGSAERKSEHWLGLFIFIKKDMQSKTQNRVILFLLSLALVVSQGLVAQTPDAGLLAGCAYDKSGNYTKALESFSIAISRNNADERLFLYRGRVLLELKEYDNAIKDFSEANEIIPGIGDIWLAKANALAGNADKAISFLKSHLSSDFRLPEDSIKKDHAFESLHTSQDWYALWEKDWYNDQEKAGKEVSYYIRKSQPDKAISYLDEQVAKPQAGPALFALRGKVYLREGNYASAIADYTTALNMEKKGGLQQYSSLNPEGSHYYNRALALLGAGRFKDALADFNKALREYPENFNGYLKRAEAYAGMENYEAARKDVMFYLNYFSNDQKAVFLCGEYLYDGGDYMNALKYFNINVKEDPTNGQYFKARGKTYLKTATYKYAMSDLAMSLDLNPDDAETWMFLGLAKIQSGDKINGCSDLHKAQQLGNTDVLKYIVDNCN